MPRRAVAYPSELALADETERENACVHVQYGEHGQSQTLRRKQPRYASDTLCKAKELRAGPKNCSQHS